MVPMTLYALGGERPRIHPEAYIHPEAVLIGEVLIGPGSSVWPGVVIRADNGPIVIGARTSVQDGAVIHTQLTNQTRIGADCVIGHLVHLEGCLLEDLVLVGSGAVVLEGVTCRSGSLVGAGAVVPPGTEIPSGAMALGVPARIRPGVVSQDSVKVNAEASAPASRRQSRGVPGGVPRVVMETDVVVFRINRSSSKRDVPPRSAAPVHGGAGRRPRSRKGRHR
jgi:carbonic anhydrase/acetyltransferase-like protein (isoleucine patch superfamily)